jgi:hypothetical protein
VSRPDNKSVGLAPPFELSSLSLDRAGTYEGRRNGQLELTVPADGAKRPGGDDLAGHGHLDSQDRGSWPGTRPHDDRPRSRLGRVQGNAEGERNLIAAGNTAEVDAVRSAYQSLLRPHATRLIEETLYRKVIGFMSANHFEPDLPAEVFILDPTDGLAAPVPHEAEHSAT